MAKLYLIFILFIYCFSAHAQKEDPACLPPSKKTQKILDKAKNAPPQEAINLFQEALDAESDNASVYFEFAKYAYNQGLYLYERDPNPKKGDKSMQRAEQLFLKTLERCSYFHADCHYYIGVINYSMGNQSDAIRSFEAFLAFDHKDIDRYHPQHMARKADVKVVLQKMKDERSILENAVPFSPKIVENVSTSNDEYFPMLSPDNEIMFYTRKSDKRLKGDLVSKIVEEFTMSHRASMHGVFDGGKPVDSPFNDGTFNSYGAATLSVDNKEMIVSACKDENVRGQIYRNCDLYVTYFEIENGKYKWSPLKNLGDGINTIDGWEAQPTLSADGNTLYYTAMRPTTRDNDIFVSERLPDGSWGASRPFDEINTAGKDKSPFFHQDSETFYFVSSVSSERKGVGGTDIFYMRKQQDGTWSKPKNIGYPINTEGDEIGLFVSTDGKEAYFSSFQKGVWNIYSFELYEEARPQSVVVVKGELKDENGAPVTDAEIEIAYSQSDKIEKVKMNGNDGKYAAIVKTKEPQDVMVSIKKEGHAFDSKIIEKEVLAKGETIRAKDMEVRKIEKGKPYTINDILYATASAELNDRSKFILKQFARFLEANPALKITIQGHTDNEGDADKNLLLSQRRADGVKQYLISLGVNESRLNAKGFGQTTPKVPNTSAENKAKNRRTDFVIE
jgi:outer membrane protein OmpA-like peptidoglycan-associated protein/tetratricopeptide (TPR) repeat protein